MIQQLSLPSMSRRRSGWLRYGVAILIAVAVLALKLVLIPLVSQDAPFLLFFVAVMGAAIFGGLGPGLLATALTGLFNCYFFMRPYGRFEIGGIDQKIRLGASSSSRGCASA